jgi:hypothetical protein
MNATIQEQTRRTRELTAGEREGGRGQMGLHDIMAGPFIIAYKAWSGTAEVWGCYGVPHLPDNAVVSGSESSTNDDPSELFLRLSRSDLELRVASWSQGRHGMKYTGAKSTCHLKWVIAICRVQNANFFPILRH